MKIKIDKQITKRIFYFLSALLLLVFLAEIIWPNSVLAYININYIFSAWVISWLLLL